MKKLIITSVVVFLSFGVALQNAGASTLSNNQVAVFKDLISIDKTFNTPLKNANNPNATKQQVINDFKPWQKVTQILIADLKKTSWPNNAQKHAYQFLSATIAFNQMFPKLLGITNKRQVDAWQSDLMKYAKIWAATAVSLEKDMGLGN